jgi:hypothetical protein
VWPFGIGKTNTSNLNFQAGQNIPNTVIVPVGTGGKIQRNWSGVAGQPGVSAGQLGEGGECLYAVFRGGL